MLLERKILILLRRYSYDEKARARYGESFDFGGRAIKKGEFMAYLRYDKHLRVSLLDRFLLGYRTLTTTFGIERETYLISRAQTRRLKMWKEKIGDALDWSKKEGFINCGENIYLLPEGRRFIKWPHFANKVSKEFDPLKKMIVSTGLGAGAGSLLTMLGQLVLGISW